MRGKKYRAEQTVTNLREAEVLLGKGMPLGEACRQLEITDVTYYRWKKEYGGLRVDQAKRLKALEAENSQFICLALAIVLICPIVCAQGVQQGNAPPITITQSQVQAAFTPGNTIVIS